MIEARSVSAMSFSLPQPRYMPCPDCGASLAAEARDTHVCDSEVRLSYELFQLRDEVAGVEEEIDAYLGSPSGQFALWEAARRRELGG